MRLAQICDLLWHSIGMQRHAGEIHERPVRRYRVRVSHVPPNWLRVLNRVKSVAWKLSGQVWKWTKPSSFQEKPGRVAAWDAVRNRDIPAQKKRAPFDVGPYEKHAFMLSMQRGENRRSVDDVGALVGQLSHRRLNQ